LKLDLIASFLQSAHEPFLRVLPIAFIKRVAPQIFIALLLAQDMVDDHQNGVSNRNECSLPASTSCDAMVVCGKVGVLGSRRCVGRLNEELT